MRPGSGSVFISTCFCKICSHSRGLGTSMHALYFTWAVAAEGR